MRGDKSNIRSIMEVAGLALLWGLMISRFPISRAAVLFLLVVLLSCKKDKREEFFELNHHVDFTIAPGLNTFDTHIYSFSPVPSFYESKLEATNHTRDQVVAIEPKRAYLSSIFEDVNLDFIHQVSILIFDPLNPGNKIEFFYLDPVPFKDKTGIQLFPGIADITEWVDSDYFGIEIRLNLRQNSPSLIQMRLQFDMRVMGE